MPLLPHVFEPNFAKQYKLHQEFSDKVMDYTWQRGSGAVRNKNNRMSFTRYHWYQLQSDKSVYKL